AGGDEDTGVSADGDSKARVSVGGDRDAHDDDEVLAAAAHARDFEALYRGDTTGFPSVSEADLSLMNRLAFYCGPNQYDQVKRLFLGSGLGARDKADRDDYLDRTAARAYQNRTAYFRWGSRTNGKASASGKRKGAGGGYSSDYILGRGDR